MLHGTSGDGEQFYNHSGWKELGEQENFITVFPSSLRWCFNDDGIEKHNTKWVCGDLTSTPCVIPQTYANDVSFFKKIISLINDTLPINTLRIYASGFSNGCAMIHKLAMEAGDVFAAVAGSSGALHMVDSTLTPLKRIPVWLMVGTLDDRFYKPPYTAIPYGRDSVLGYLRGLLNRAILCQNLSQQFTFYESPINHTYVFDQDQSGQKSQSPYIFTLNKDQTHEFPNGTNYPVSAPKLFWNFFNNPLSVSTTSVDIDKFDLAVYPNPSNDIIHLKIDNPDDNTVVRLKIINPLGQVFFQSRVFSHSMIELHKREFGSGVFLLIAETGTKVICKKIHFI
jgi:polyhydroxybutyrate depolymerase